ncbi:MAG: DUF2279 domain-containing protein [Ignavibacteria bacterium]|nr:DUF2279 domain-containing protein [Ignavibacteria bacterium]MCU7503948.1 DUF2279 domain-containing protein [Ignavibacteria bacterium]MCU7515831.1 DUF2279 domain-containing protein [Ignavibacteria bacterium]
MPKYILLFVLFFCCSSASSSAAAEPSKGESLLQSDSTVNDPKPAKYLSLNEFTYAGERRYILDGSLPLMKTEIKPVTASIVGGIYLGAIVGLHINQRNAWWKDNRQAFHFQEDWFSAVQVDKAGHFFGGYITSYVMGEGLLASGISYESSAIWGSALALAYQTYVETEDGFAKQWGFSPSDWYFDLLGASFFLAQHYNPLLQNVTPKWQFVPSEWTGKPIILRPRTFIDDYNSSTFWYSVDVYNLLNENGKKYWPKWLNLAVGYGGDAIDANPDPNGPPDQLSVRRYVLGLDLNLVRLLPSGGWFWNWARQSLNYIKLPAPAVEFTEKGTKFYVLYPFRFSLGNLRF